MHQAQTEFLYILKTAQDKLSKNYYSNKTLICVFGIEIFSSSMPTVLSVNVQTKSSLHYHSKNIMFGNLRNLPELVVFVLTFLLVVSSVSGFDFGGLLMGILVGWFTSLLNVSSGFIAAFTLAAMSRKEIYLSIRSLNEPWKRIITFFSIATCHNNRIKYCNYHYKEI